MLNNPKAASWHVAYTMPRSEKKAYESLGQLGITSFFPVQYVWRQWSDRIKKLELPLFPNYIFVHTTPHKRHEAMNVKEVIRYVCFDGKPATVTDNLLESLKKISGNNVEVVDHTFDKPGMPVMICQGPFSGVQGELIRKNGRCKLLIRIESLCSSISMEIDASAVAPMDENFIFNNNETLYAHP